MSKIVCFPEGLGGFSSRSLELVLIFASQHSPADSDLSRAPALIVLPIARGKLNCLDLV